jgi:hypothetical protein
LRNYESDGISIEKLECLLAKQQQRGSQPSKLPIEILMTAAIAVILYTTNIDEYTHRLSSKAEHKDNKMSVFTIAKSFKN